MRLILRTLLGVGIGLGYGVLVGGLLLLISLAAGGPPVDLMLDYTKIARLIILLVAIITGSTGAVVGFMVTLLRVNDFKAGTIGFGFGWVILAGIVITIWPQLKNELSATDSWVEVRLLFAIFLVLFVMFPLGLAATGMTVVRISDKFAPR